MRAILTALLLVGFTAACDTRGASSAHAAVPVAAVDVSGAWASVMPPGVDVGAGYLTITNHGANEDRLLSASSPRAQSVMLHDMHMEGSMMVMRMAEDGMAVPAHGALTLSPGGGHLMFMGVSQRFEAGQSIPVTLTFAHAGRVSVELPVRTRP